MPVPHLLLLECLISRRVLPAISLAVGSQAFLLQSSSYRSGRRTRRFALLGNAYSEGDQFDQSSRRDPPIPCLSTFFAADHPKPTVTGDACGQASAHVRLVMPGQIATRFKIEKKRNPGVDFVDILSAGPGASGKASLYPTFQIHLVKIFECHYNVKPTSDAQRFQRRSSRRASC